MLRMMQGRSRETTLETVIIEETVVKGRRSLRGKERHG